MPRVLASQSYGIASSLPSILTTELSTQGKAAQWQAVFIAVKEDFNLLHRATGYTSATLLALPIHTSINDAGLSVGHFGTFRSTRYRYSDVTKITVTDGLRLRDGSLQKRPAITLGFENGTRWSSADNRDPEKSIDQSLLNFLEEKTHLSAAHLDAFPFGSA
jgi:hypothetical protein